MKAESFSSDFNLLILSNSASILGFLPEEFNYQQVEALRVEHRMSAKGTMKMLNNWLFRGYIKVKEKDSNTQLLKYSVFIKTHY